MAAPTPVSSLVHSSTLVTAGVYLLIRLNYILRSLEFLWGLAGLGLLTIIMAGIRAVGELDIKKVIALSTLSQLGLIIITLGLGLPTFAFFHLVSHAYFKAMLFIRAGAIIHTFKDYQDLRALGGGVASLPFSRRIFLAANLSLCGIPFMSGFYSKDFILEFFFIKSSNPLIISLVILSVMLTVIYSFQLSLNIFYGALKSEPIFSLREINSSIKMRIVVLLGLSCIGGLGISWLTESHSSLIFLPLWLKLLVLFLIITSPMIWGSAVKFNHSIVTKFRHFI